MGRMQRDKGANYERELANELKPFFPSSRRGIGQARSASEVSDVEGTPFWIEAKRGKQPNVRAAFRQAQAATDGRPVLVVIRDDNQPAFVSMLLDDFKKMFLTPANDNGLPESNE